MASSPLLQGRGVKKRRLASATFHYKNAGAFSIN
jgi:hypothetical protein